jgi:polyhydroxyalkanoate synthesis regulator phasin
MVKHGTTAPRTRDIPRELLDRGREMAGFGRDIWLAGLGALAVAGEETGELFDRLVESGEEFETRGRSELTARQKQVAEALDDRVYAPVLTGLRRLGVPTRGEMHDLAAKVDRLARKVDALVTHVTGEAPADEDVRRTVHVYKLVARPEGWAVEGDGGKEPLGTWPTKDEALDHARALAQEAHPSRLDVYKKDGTLQETLAF